MTSPARPTLGKWIAICFKIGALSFGGSGRVLLYREEVVERHPWLSAERFNEIFTLAQVFPGPNLVNIAAYLGYELAGPLAAVLGVIALCVPGALMAVALTAAFAFQGKGWDALFKGFSLGSLSLFFVLLAQLVPGIQSAPGGRQAPPYKVAARGALALGIAAVSVAGYPLTPLIGVGVALGLALEFLT